MTKHTSPIPWNSLPILTIEEWLESEKRKRHNLSCRIYRKRRKKKMLAASKGRRQDKLHPWITKPVEDVE